MSSTLIAPSSERCTLSAMIWPSCDPICSPRFCTHAPMPSFRRPRPRAIAPPSSPSMTLWIFEEPERPRIWKDGSRISKRKKIVKRAEVTLLYVRLQTEAPLLQTAQQRIQPALFARHLEAGRARAVEQRDGHRHRRQRLALAALLPEQRLDARGEVEEVPEAEGRGQVGQRSGAGGRGREGEPDVGQRDLASVAEDQHQIRPGPQRSCALHRLVDLVP